MANMKAPLALLRVYALTFLIFCLAACSKSGGDPGTNNNGNSNGNNGGNNGNNGGNGGGGNTLPAYTFTAPQFVISQASTVGFPQQSFVQKNIVLTAQYNANYVFSSNGVYILDIRWYLNRNGQSSIIYYGNSGPKLRNGYPIVGGYAITPQGDFIYASIDKVLYKIPANSLGVHTTVTAGVGVANCIKINPAGGIYMTSDSLNGSLLQVSETGTRQVIASNLGNPGVFDIYQGNFYVAQYTQVGSVVKITPTGTITNVLTNITFPCNICFDNYGNFVLQTMTTLNGVVYRIYALYTSAGVKIADLTDDANYYIAGQWPGEPSNQAITPLFIDDFNNLYFSNYAGPTSFTIGSANNPTLTKPGLWLMQLKKK